MSAASKFLRLLQGDLVLYPRPFRFSYYLNVIYHVV